jgi:hypothetical protein
MSIRIFKSKRELGELRWNAMTLQQKRIFAEGFGFRSVSSILAEELEDLDDWFNPNIVDTILKSRYTFYATMPILFLFMVIWFIVSLAFWPIDVLFIGAPTNFRAYGTTPPPEKP